jgi:LemA protein
MKTPPSVRSARSSPARSRTRGALSAAILVLLVVVGIVAVLAIASVGSYNGLQAKKTTVEQKIAALDSQFKRRFDLIPNLVETVKGAADFEQSTLQGVVDARASVGKAALPADITDPARMQMYLDAQASLGNALSRLLVVAENYPALKATQAFGELQVQLEGTENRINVAREDWTVAVRDYNTKLRTFPGNVVGGMFGFAELPQYQAEAAERETPRVDFGTQK